MKKAQKKLWFRAKTYGYGWTPVTWEGWITVFVFVTFNAYNFFRLNETAHANSDVLRPFIIGVIISIALLFALRKGRNWGGGGEVGSVR